MAETSPGWTSVCLKVEDLQASRRFYEALGLETLEVVPGQRVVLRNGSFRLALMPFLEQNLLNFRGADVVARFEALSRALPGLEGSPRHYRAAEGGADADGTCWSTRDPDGNEIFFDTNRSEEGEAFRARRVRQILEDAETELRDAGASAACLEALRREVIDRFVDRE